MTKEGLPKAEHAGEDGGEEGQLPTSGEAPEDNPAHGDQDGASLLTAASLGLQKQSFGSRTKFDVPRGCRRKSAIVAKGVGATSAQAGPGQATSQGVLARVQRR